MFFIYSFEYPKKVLQNEKLSEVTDLSLTKSLTKSLKIVLIIQIICSVHCILYMLIFMDISNELLLVSLLNKAYMRSRRNLLEVRKSSADWK